MFDGFDVWCTLMTIVVGDDAWYKVMASVVRDDVLR